ncbi:hypothetical protein CDA63_13645 [Hymenobacter amundsenii]|uniref:Uncharacterized protein n=1 Tax=Hymenobacter amundsenii TaxID=2006685 RepID=A0A246FJ28_9BACT|nr:hypothetical protein CDA63_13645 [Hymenobacter amundsenii]
MFSSPGYFMQHFRYAFLAAPLLSGCLSHRVLSTEPDAALMLKVENRLVLSSLNSAQQTAIYKTVRRGDTLLITYRRGLFVRTNANTVLLSDDVRFVKCAGQLFSVKRATDGVILERR